MTTETIRHVGDLMLDRLVELAGDVAIHRRDVRDAKEALDKAAEGMGHMTRANNELTIARESLARERVRLLTENRNLLNREQAGLIVISALVEAVKQSFSRTRSKGGSFALKKAIDAAQDHISSFVPF